MRATKADIREQARLLILEDIANSKRDNILDDLIAKCEEQNSTRPAVEYFPESPIPFHGMTVKACIKALELLGDVWTEEALRVVKMFRFSQGAWKPYI